MQLTDGHLLTVWTRRTAQWGGLLESLHRYHRRSLGREVGPIHWLGSPEFGPWTWLGFFWQAERFWFGFGFDGATWRPLIEAEARNVHSQAWEKLGNQLPQVWTHMRGDTYRRLWSPLDLPDKMKSREKWFRERSHELHEYAVS